MPPALLFDISDLDLQAKPLFDKKANKAQKDLPRLNETGPVYFCGAYFSYGFHEDGVNSALEVCKHFGKIL